ncbi:MAG: hypothetical protein K8W52_47025 [Deltaproteobacteria bacterium]|nr:hypothetical protein [Deltaproteobacteria bacterium]
MRLMRTSRRCTAPRAVPPRTNRVRLGAPPKAVIVEDRSGERDALGALIVPATRRRPCAWRTRD